MSGRIALLRHGQTEWSAAGRHTSTTDLDLTAEGERQAAAVPEILAHLGIVPASVLSSPRRRALRTAELAGLSVTAVDDDLAEWDYGQYEGLTSAQITAAAPGWSVFTDGAPDGESPEQVTARADRVLSRAAAAAADGDVVLVGHGHFSRVLAARWPGLDLSVGSALELDPATVSVLGHHHHRRTLERLNVPARTAAGSG